MIINPFNPGEVGTPGLSLSGLLSAVGETVSLDSAVDWNTLIQPGVYKVTGIAANFPIYVGLSPSLPGILEVLESNGSVLQTYYSAKSEQFSRTYTTLGWSPWSTVSVPVAPFLGFSDSAILATTGVINNFNNFTSAGLAGFDSAAGTFSPALSGTYYIELTLDPVSAPAIGTVSITGARQSFNLATNESMTHSVIRALPVGAGFTTFDVTLNSGSVKGRSGYIVKLI